MPAAALESASSSLPICVFELQGSRHFQDQCHVMKEGALVRIPDMPQAAPDGTGTHWVLVSKGVHTVPLWIRVATTPQFTKNLVQGEAPATYSKARYVISKTKT